MTRRRAASLSPRWVGTEIQVAAGRRPREVLPIRPATLLTLLAAALAITPVVAAGTPYSAAGTFAAGAPTDNDACLDRQLQGLSSTCVSIRADAIGRDYHLSASGVGRVVGLEACFYDALLVPLRCDAVATEDDAAALQTSLSKEGPASSSITSSVPAGAAFMAVKASAGLKVSWFFASY